MYKCDYCHRVYTLKKYFVKHFALCKQHAKMQTEKDVDRLEFEPNVKEMFVLMKEMTFRISELEKEVKKLKSKTSQTNRKEIMLFLNEHCSSPNPPTFSAWVQSIVIDNTDLDCVFQTDLNDGMKNAIIRALNNEKTMSHLPVCCFSKNPNQFYMHEPSNHENDAPQWRKMTKTDFEKLLSFVSRQLLFQFIRWQDENREFIDTNEKIREEELNCMLKINCSVSSMDRRIEHLKKWLFAKMQDAVSIVSVEFS